MQSEDDAAQGKLGPHSGSAAEEKEWNEHLAARFRQLESLLKQAKEEKLDLSQRYQQLRVDFEYNLALLDERDGELERYDVITARAVTAEQSRLKELKLLRTQVEKLEEDRKEEQHNKSQHTLQLEELKHSMAREMEKQTAEWERTKCCLQQRIEELEGQLTLQRQEVAEGFDSVLRQWEHKLNLKIDELHGMMVSLNLKVPWMIVKEIKALTAVHDNRYEDLVSAQKKQDAQLEAQHQSHARELQKAEENLVNCRRGVEVLAAQVCSLQEEQQEAKKHREETTQRYDHLVQAQKKYDEQLEARDQSHTRELQKAEKHVARFHKRMEVLSAQVCRLQADQHEALKQREEMIQRLCTELKKTQNGWETYISQVSSEMVVKNTEMITLQKTQRELQAELETKMEEVERYKQQLSAGLNRGKAEEHLHVQEEVAAQRQYEETEAKHYSQQLLQDLTQTRNQCVSVKRDCLASEGKLQEQINFLWALVSQMKKDVESFTLLQTQGRASSPQCSGARAATSIPPGAPMTVGPPADFTNSLSKVSPAEELSKPSPVTGHVVRAEHKQSAGLNALVRQLQKENLHLRRQLASGDPPYMRTRLKQAAFHIARLSREKQQLIDLGNHLGSELINAGLQGENNKPEKLEDLSTKEQGDQQVADNRLSLLEQLQYKLTTKELQHCLRKRVSTVDEYEEVRPVTSSQGAANPWSPGRTTDRSETLNAPLNLGPRPLSGPPWSELSSGESLQSLKELWEMLEPGHTSALLSEGELCKMECDGAGVGMMVHGTGVPIHSRPTTDVQQRMDPYKTPPNPAKSSRVAKIRNYNIKD